MLGSTFAGAAVTCAGGPSVATDDGVGDDAGGSVSTTGGTVTGAGVDATVVATGKYTSPTPQIRKLFLVGVSVVPPSLKK